MRKARFSINSKRDIGVTGQWLDQGIYFVNPEAKPGHAIEFFSFATRRLTQIATMEKEPLRWDPGFAISPDGRCVLYGQVDQSGSDIMLVENFQ